MRKIYEETTERLEGELEVTKLIKMVRNHAILLESKFINSDPSLRDKILKEKRNVINLLSSDENMETETDRVPTEPVEMKDLGKQLEEMFGKKKVEEES